MMLKKVILCCFLMMSATCYASITSATVSEFGFSDLSDQDKAEVLKFIADKSSKPVVSSEIPSPDVVSKWATIGTQIASGIGAAAKELNVEVNAFAQTPVGEMTMILIIWKMVGSEIAHFLIGLLIWIVGLVSVFMLTKRAEPDTIVYSDTEKNIFGNYVIKSIKKHELTTDETIGFSIMASFVIVVGLVIMVTG